MLLFSSSLFPSVLFLFKGPKWSVILIGERGKGDVVASGIKGPQESRYMYTYAS